MPASQSIKPRHLIAALTLAVASPTWAADTYQTGTITNITTIPEGVLVMLDTDPPTNCTGTPYNWMLVPEANKTMVAAVFMMWMSGQRRVTVYSAAPYTGNGFCKLGQVDPE